MSALNLRITLAIATLGRPDDLTEGLRDLARQTRLPDRLIVSATGPDDLGRAAEVAPVPVEAIYGAKGLTKQRNRVLDRLEHEDILLFLDDDFVMAEDYIARLADLFTARPDVVIATGDVLADGIGGAGLTMEDAQAILRAAPVVRDPDPVQVNNGYGCNMAFRTGPIKAHRIRFDEALPLYGWLEDVDFSAKLASYGNCIRSRELRGVHLGTKSGRTSGVKLGYSQVANPVYLARRATMRPTHALRMISRNLAANTAKALWPEPWVDRRGRLRGNLLALADLLRGRVDPMRATRLDGPARTKHRPGAETG